jgi:hypothetical protein
LSLRLAQGLSYKQIAEITDFDLYVTTTFDSLMEDALNTVRFGGIRSTDVLAYAPNKVTDLAVERAQLARPLVYHLMGRLSASPTYVISDEDVLEFVCSLQTAHYTPQKLFRELEHSHLLLLGGGFSDWLTRMFLRLAKRRRLSEPRDFGEVLAEIGRRNNVEVRNEELVAAIQEEARRFPGRERDVIQFYQQNPNAVAQIRAPLYEEKVVDFILELAQVTNVDVTREELMADSED